ncbi:glycosyltransferase family 2 protein [Burkholderia sp. 22PA0099]|uniref:glycosyltransferase family 2 protein n=1 Tax=Burkholderia sp. 22PA0099 TaxID=3237372 RepID=UPI0039C4C1F1
MHIVPTNLLTVSIVVYRMGPAQLTQTLSSLLVALGQLDAARPGQRSELWLIDNGDSPASLPVLDAFRAHGIDCIVMAGHGNVGYGRGHNLAIERVSSGYHLVLNPDIDLDADALVAALDFLDAHPDVGLLSPRVEDADGHLQFLCRRYPALLDLFVRGFLPRSLRQHFEARLVRYEMRDRMTGTEVFRDPPIVSGCFMLFRTNTLKQLNGFDSRYFLYFEDYDLSLRAGKVARLAYVPAVRVVHHGGGAARKGFAHIRMFAASAFKFYRRFGWRCW